MIKKVLFIIIFILLPITAQAAVLDLNPASKNVDLNNNFAVEIILDTQEVNTDGTDVHYLNYDDSILEVQSITPGVLYANTAVSTGANGKINFSQAAQGGRSYNGKGVLATIIFKAIAEGSSALTFDFTPGNTLDCNVASSGQDVLSSAINGNYVVSVPGDTTPPIISQVASNNITTNSAIITWTTDEPTTSRVEYGFTAAYGSQIEDPALVTNHTINLSNLSDDSTYHFRVRSKDAEDNESISNDNTFQTQKLILPDTTPPAVIVLASSNITETSVDLNWIAPGDDADQGTAVVYDIRYSTNAFDWPNANQLDGEPVPRAAGNSESYTAVDLDYNTYYFAIKAADEVPNWSNISNIIQITTIAPPEPEPDPEPAPDPIPGGGGTARDSIPPPPIKSLQAQAGDSQIALFWENPISSDWVRTIIERDGAKIYEGVGQEFVDINLVNDTTYSYTAFSIDRAGNYSSKKTVSDTPQSGIESIPLEEPEVEIPDSPPPTIREAMIAVIKQLILLITQLIIKLQEQLLATAALIF